VNESFPRGEILLACGLALALRLLYLVGVAHGPLFLHPLIDVPAGHPYGWFLAAISGVTGNDPLAPRVAQALLDTGSVFLLAATAHEVWGRRAAVATAEVAALYGPLVYFASDLSPAIFSFFLVSATLYLTSRASRARSRGGILLSAMGLALATILAIAGAGTAVSGATAAKTPHFLGNLVTAWNRREVPCGLDQAFFAPFNSPIFRLPWLPSFWLIGPIALVTAWIERRRAPLLTGYLIVATVAIAMTHVCDRSRLTLLAAGIPLAGHGIDRFFAAFSKATEKARSWLGAALAEVACAHGMTLIAFGAALVLVTAPFRSLQRTQSGPGWVLLARAYEASENPREAQKAYDSAERSGMRSADFYADWGRLEQDKSLGILAEQHLLTAISMNPGHPTAHETLGDVYSSRGSYHQAGQEYSVAAGIVPRRAAELFTRAGGALEEGGARERAAEMYEKALEATPGYPAAKTGLERVRKPAVPPQPVKMFPPLSR
jgi:tetratricopeptide (TPR) repeat protein